MQRCAHCGQQFQRCPNCQQKIEEKKPVYQPEANLMKKLARRLPRGTVSIESGQ